MIIETLKTSDFSKHRAKDGTLTYSQEISTLRWKQVPDRIDLISERTGNKLLFACIGPVRDTEEDILGWNYSNPNFPEMIVFVEND